MSDTSASASRRTVLGALGASLGVGVAGCSSASERETVTVSRELSSGVAATDIQAAIDDLHASVPDGGRGVVELPNEVVDLDQRLTLRSNTYLKDYVFAHAAGFDGTAIATEGFETLTGSNSWLVDGSDSPSGVDGVPFNCGLINGHIDGRRASTSTDAAVTSYDGHAISGVALYAKGVNLEGVVSVVDCAGTSLYSECANKKGKNDWRDRPTTTADVLLLDNGGGDGFHFRGPHDSHFPHVEAAGHDGYGVLTEFERDVYGGGATFGKVHPYSNAQGSRLAAATSNCTTLVVDNEPVTVAAGPSHFGTIKIVGQSPQLELANIVQFDSILAQTGTDAGDLIRLNHSGIDGGRIRARGAAGSNVVIDSSLVSVDMVRSLDAGAYNVVLGDSGPVNNCPVAFRQVTGAGTAAFKYGGGNRNVVGGAGYIAPGETALDLTAGQKPTANDDFRLWFNGGGENVGFSREWRTAMFDGDGSAAYDVPHNLLATPEQFWAMGANGVTPAVTRWLRPQSDDETVRVEFAAAIPVGDPVRIGYFASI